MSIEWNCDCWCEDDDGLWTIAAGCGWILVVVWDDVVGMFFWLSSENGYGGAEMIKPSGCWYEKQVELI